MLDYLQFVRYWLGLRCKSALGLHSTVNPLGLSWRWKHWKRAQERRADQD